LPRGKGRGARKHERKKKEENQQEKRKNTIKPSPNLDSKGMELPSSCS
jgi:hypothetical protein